MKLALMQPYFLPYLGYFALVAASDVWVIFDDAQYMKGGWINRNRVLKPGGGWQYIGVPVSKHSVKAPIHTVQAARRGWGDKVVRQLAHYRGAPHFDAVMQRLEAWFAACPSDVCGTNEALLAGVCRWIGLPFAPKRHSQLGLDHGPVRAPGDWAFECARQMGATTYLNAPGGRDLYDPQRFAEAGMDLRFVELEAVQYDQQRAEFEPWLSVVDALMFLGPEGTREAIGRHRLAP